MDTYPAGTVRALLDTEAVTEPTRAALRARLAQPAVSTPAFLSEAEFATLRAICARLLPGSGSGPGSDIDVAGPMDARLAGGGGDGWRYDALPADGEACRRGLSGFDEAARAGFGAEFASLPPDAQDAVLLAVQRGEAAGETWRSLPPARFFEELLAEATETYVAHPLAQEAIGYAGMADALGWTRVGLDEREPREPVAQRG